MKLALERLLRAQSLSTLELTEALGGGVREIRQLLRDAEKSVHNVGTGEHPIWTWKIGDRTSAEVLRGTVRRLLSERPMSQQQVVQATGASQRRVANAIKQLRRVEEFDIYGEMLFLSVQ